MRSGLIMADEFVTKLFDQVDEAITVIETVKKIPDFNANLSVELAMSCASMHGFASDQRKDDGYLCEDEEPVSVALSEMFVELHITSDSNVFCFSCLRGLLEKITA